MQLNGSFYSYKKHGYDAKMNQCVVETVKSLETIGNRPLMLLGRIQSGKTRAFTGVIALAFDNRYDLAVVLTKNSNVLARQTTVRMQQEFAPFRQADVLEVYDIMAMPSFFSGYEMRKKLILVVKKEKTNLKRLMGFIKAYGQTARRCLIIDDEADFGSVGYQKKDGEDDLYDLRKIAKQINTLRTMADCRFIQVTATPYALYLQPDTVTLEGQHIEPVKPAKTVLVPSGKGYIGGKAYFDDRPKSPARYIARSIEEEELILIKTSDRRRFKVETALHNPRIEGIRTAMMTFITASAVRIIQNGGKPLGPANKFSFIIHTEVAKAAHARQEELVIALLKQMQNALSKNKNALDTLLKAAYTDLKRSVDCLHLPMPAYPLVRRYVCGALLREWVSVSTVNSEQDVTALLDEQGQLRLRTPMNIFIGGQLLDRGITVANLIGFYYGRSPKKMQQDTVLQHARMYGYRRVADFAVTRFYTTPSLYLKMKQIHQFDTRLREDIEKGRASGRILFLNRDESGKIIPCAPGKIAMSDTRLLRPGSTLLPVGFTTTSRTAARKTLSKLDQTVKKLLGQAKDNAVIGRAMAEELIQAAYGLFKPEIENGVDAAEMCALLRYLAKDKVTLYCRTDRNISRFRKTTRHYSDMPYNRDSDLKKARALATNAPTLMFLRQNGTREAGWEGTPFYWPVLVVQKQLTPAIYTSGVLRH